MLLLSFLWSLQEGWEQAHAVRAGLEDDLGSQQAHHSPCQAPAESATALELGAYSGKIMSQESHESLVKAVNRASEPDWSESSG